MELLLTILFCVAYIGVPFAVQWFVRQEGSFDGYDQASRFFEDPVGTFRSARLVAGAGRSEAGQLSLETEQQAGQLSESPRGSLRLVDSEA